MKAILATALLLAGAAGLAWQARADDRAQTIQADRLRYAGTWKVVSLVVDGKVIQDAAGQDFTVVNTADGGWILSAKGKVIGRGTSQIDPSTHPRSIDLVPTDGNNAGKTHAAIYELGKDSRKVCLAPPGKPRPTEFSSSPGSGTILAHFQRQNLPPGK